MNEKTTEKNTEIFSTETHNWLLFAEDVITYPSRNTIKELQSYVPQKTVTLYKMWVPTFSETIIRNNYPEIWSYNEAKIKKLAKCYNYAVISAEFQPNQIIVDCDLLPPSYIDKISQNPITQQVIVYPGVYMFQIQCAFCSNPIDKTAHSTCGIFIPTLFVSPGFCCECGKGMCSDHIGSKMYIDGFSKIWCQSCTNEENNKRKRVNEKLNRDIKKFQRKWPCIGKCIGTLWLQLYKEEPLPKEIVKFSPIS